MRIPLTKYGWPQVVIIPGALLAAMIFFAVYGFPFAGEDGEGYHGLSLWAFILIEVVLGCVLVFSLAFFRDPRRSCPSDMSLLLAPADGRVTDIEISGDNGFIDGTALRIGIFLSILDTHINRMPCNVKVEEITYKKGRYKNAMNPESARVNESNTLSLTRTDSPEDRLVVRQISGAIARRIVCKTRAGDKLAAGEKFGMIKYGSRTELYVTVRDSKYKIECLVRKGDKVKAGLTPLARYETCRN
jgi:phosphatidylserine decarboxylase